MEIMDGKLVVNRKKKAVIVTELRKRDYEPFPKNQENKKTKAEEDEAEGEEDGENGEEASAENGDRDFDYLLSVSSIVFWLDEVLLTTHRCPSGRSRRNAWTS